MQVIDLLRARLKSYNKGKPLGNKCTSIASVMAYTQQNTASNVFSLNLLPRKEEKKSSCYDHIICYTSLRSYYFLIFSAGGVQPAPGRGGYHGHPP